MIRRPADTNPFEFAVVSGLRAAQLMRGCIPRVERAEKVIITAQMEVAAGLVARIPLGVIVPEPV
jgi:DNA-directed RNA polymerase subunit K/omega